MPDRKASRTSGRLRTANGVSSKDHRSPRSAALKRTRTNFRPTYIARKTLIPRARYLGRKKSRSHEPTGSSAFRRNLLSNPIPPNAHGDEDDRNVECDHHQNPTVDRGEAPEKTRAVLHLGERREAAEVRRRDAEPFPVHRAHDERHADLRAFGKRLTRRAICGRGKGPDGERADRFRELGCPVRGGVVGVRRE